MESKADIQKTKQVEGYPAIIDQLVNAIIREVSPLKILLFGSYARGEMGPHSDIDIFIIMPEGIHRRKTAQFLYRKIKGVGIPFDILVATPSDLDKHKDNIGLIYHTILSEGKEVYAAG